MDTMITVYAFRWVPPFAQGFVKDLRVRWALEEAGIPYQERLIGAKDQKSAAYRELQPFGQVPAIETGDLKLFESGAIVIYIAERSEGLMPPDANGRARVSAWIFAALSSVEPFVQNLNELEASAAEPWALVRRPAIEEAVRKRLVAVENRLVGRDYLEDRFTAADLMMTTVLRNLGDSQIMSDRPVLRAYVERCQGRAAFQKALADHLRPFATNPG
jgi:glutathione S-transferase